jgi:hypothetical protein
MHATTVPKYQSRMLRKVRDVGDIMEDHISGKGGVYDYGPNFQ